MSMINEDLPAMLQANGLDPAPLHKASGLGAAETLKTLTDLTGGHYNGESNSPSKETLAKLQCSIDQSLRAVARAIVSTADVTVADDAPIQAGGFSWVITVTHQDQQCALVLPKFARGDYKEKIAVRAEIGRLVPRTERYSMPRTLASSESPVPWCLMTYAHGENCYPRTFDSNGKPHEGGIGPAPGIEVFHKLGEIASGFSTVCGERFGALVRLPYASATEYIRSHTDRINAELLPSCSSEVSRYDLTCQQLQRIVEWVMRDAQTQTVSYLMHGDLSPWNLLHDTATNSWSLVDGDDARFGIFGEQIGVCLNSMRGNLNRAWIEALLDGYGAQGLDQRRDLILRGAAYGTVTYGLTNALNPWDPRNVQMCREVAFSLLAPCAKLFDELA